jgi:putative nucleotide binding protein
METEKEEKLKPNESEAASEQKEEGGSQQTTTTTTTTVITPSGSSRPRETFIVLDFMHHGSRLDKRPIHLKERVAQVLSKELLVLLEFIPTPDYSPKLGDVVFNDDKTKIAKVVGRIPLSRLTNVARAELSAVLEDVVSEDDARFIDFFNKSQPLTMRQHSLELLPGIGKKHMWTIIEARKIKPFESFNDLRERIKLLSDPRKAVVKRIIAELDEQEKYYVFVKPPSLLRERDRDKSW